MDDLISRDVASAVVAGMAPFYIGETRFADHASLAKQIPNIPLPDHAALLAHALRLPEVAALAEAMREIAQNGDDRAARIARDALVRMGGKV